MVVKREHAQRLFGPDKNMHLSRDMSGNEIKSGAVVLKAVDILDHLKIDLLKNVGRAPSDGHQTFRERKYTQWDEQWWNGLEVGERVVYTGLSA